MRLVISSGLARLVFGVTFWGLLESQKRVQIFIAPPKYNEKQVTLEFVAR